MISIENYTHTLLRKISEAGGEGRAGGRPLDRREDGEAADPGGTGDRPGILVEICRFHLLFSQIRDELLSMRSLD